MKDILAFANSWRRNDAYILIGVRESSSPPAEVVGITRHIAEASLQQFVRGKVNRPPPFSYEAVTLEGREIGVIRIGSGARPFYATRNFGGVRARDVYFRQGSSTAVAIPDEVAKMGETGLPSGPVVSIEWLALDTKVAVGKELRRTVGVIRSTARTKLPRIRQDRLSALVRPSNADYYLDAYDHVCATLMFRKLGLVATNLSATVALDVRAEFTVPKALGLLFHDERSFPRYPSRSADFGSRLPVFTGPVDVSVEELSDRYEVTLLIGKIQPKARVCCGSPLWVGASTSCAATLPGKIFADNAEPQDCALRVALSAKAKAISHDALLQLLDRMDPPHS